MKTLYLIRHAKSSWGNPGLRDFDRPLNERGLHDAPKMAAFMVKQGANPDLLVSSPAKRALSTAIFFAETFGKDAAEIQKDPEIYEAFPAKILQIISRLPEQAREVCLFGHNPTFTEVANIFVSGSQFIENVPTCGIVKITTLAPFWNELYEGNASIAACYFPKEVL